MPQVVAHRGASGLYPEHTLAAYRAAVAQGADALECDVRLTADGELVCFHDRTLLRTGLREGIISASTLAQLETIDFGAWKKPSTVEWSREEVGILTMRRLLEFALENKVRLAIETKHPTRYGNRVEEALIRLLAEYGLTGPDSPVRIMSFSWKALRRVRRLAPDLEVVYLMDRPHRWWRARLMGEPDWIAGPGIDVVRRFPALAERWAASPTRVHVWTVNEPEDMDLCAAYGFEALITNWPSEMRARLETTR